MPYQPCWPLSTAGTLPACRSSRSRSSRGTKRRTSARRLTSVAWADEIIVVDSESTDDTVAIARQFTDRVIVRAWPGYVAQKNYAASLASHDWILSLDADERVTPELAAEIRSTLAAAVLRARLPHAAGDVAPRALDPDHRLVSRLSAAALRPARRRMDRALRARGDDGPGPGRPAARRAAALRLSRHRRSPRNHRPLHDATPRARCRRAAGAPGCCELAGHPPLAFLRNYMLKGGIRDGMPGLIISAMNAYYVFLKFAKLWELRNQQDDPWSLPFTCTTLKAGIRRSSARPDARTKLGIRSRRVAICVLGDLSSLARCSPCTSTRPEPGEAARTRSC